MAGAKALLIRPNVAALRLVGIRARPLPFRLGKSAMMTATTGYNHSIGRSLFMGLLPLSYLACPVRRNFCIRATTDSDNPANIESPLMESMERKIKENLNAESVIVKDAYGDGRHVSIEVISSAFEGQSAVNRQRMVYKAIWEELQERVHAVDQMTTWTPSELANLGK